MGLESEVFRRERINHTPLPFFHGKTKIIIDIHREYVVLQFIASRIPVRSREGQTVRNQPDNQPGTSHLFPEHRRQMHPLFTTDSCNHNRRDIDHTNQDDRRPQIIQQFTGFRHVGRRQVQKHIDSDHRFAEQVE